MGEPNYFINPNEGEAYAFSLRRVGFVGGYAIVKAYGSMPLPPALLNDKGAEIPPHSESALKDWLKAAIAAGPPRTINAAVDSDIEGADSMAAMLKEVGIPTITKSFAAEKADAA